MESIEMRPQDILKRLEKAFTPLDKTTFCWAFFGGLLIHLYRLTNFAMVAETPYFFYSQNNRSDHGRWFLHHVTDWTGWLDLPWLNGVVTIAYLALASVLVVRLLKIQSKAVAALAGLLFLANPATAATIHFTYLADGFAFAVLLSSLAVFCVEQSMDLGGLKTISGIAAGAVALCLSLAIYQSGLSLAVFLCIVILARALFERDLKLWRRVIRMLTMGVVGTLLYLISVKLIDAPMTDHASLNTLGKVNFEGSLNMLKWLYLDSTHPYMDLLVYPTNLVWQLLGWFGLALFAGIILLLTVHTQLWKRPLELIVLGIMMAAIPASWWLINILQPEVGGQNALQAHSSALMWPVLLAFIEYVTVRISGQGKKLLPRMIWLIQWGGWTCCALLAFHFIVFNNQFYTLSRLTYEKDQALYSRALGRMEEQPEYQFGMPLLIDGAPAQAENTTPLAEFSGKLNKYMAQFQPRSSVYGDGQRLFLNSFLNADFQDVDADTKARILNSEEFAAMPVWPAEGSIQVIDGVMVMKNQTD